MFMSIFINFNVKFQVRKPSDVSPLLVRGRQPDAHAVLGPPLHRDDKLRGNNQNGKRIDLLTYRFFPFLSLFTYYFYFQI